LNFKKSAESRITDAENINNYVSLQRPSSQLSLTCVHLEERVDIHGVDIHHREFGHTILLHVRHLLHKKTLKRPSSVPVSKNIEFFKKRLTLLFYSFSPIPVKH
jgi:hypothetical protein